MADEQYLTVEQVADELSVTRVTVRRWINNGELPAAKAGPRRWAIRRSDLNRFLVPGGRSGQPGHASENPSFIEQLIEPNDR
jgi:excisionase family DNA binding protein